MPALKCLLYAFELTNEGSIGIRGKNPPPFYCKYFILSALEILVIAVSIKNIIFIYPELGRYQVSRKTDWSEK